MLWQYWGEEWLLNERVAFNGDSKTIVVNEGVTAIDIRAHVYSAWVRWRARGNDHFPEAMRRSGFDLIPGGRTGDTYFVINGWKLLVDLTKVKVSGVLFSDDFDTPYFSSVSGNPLYPAVVSSLVSTAVVPATVSAADIRVEMDTSSTKLQEITTKVLDVPTEVWNLPTSITLVPGSFGYYLYNKVLSVSKFLGLK